MKDGDKNILDCLIHNQRVWQETVHRANAQLRQAEQGLGESIQSVEDFKNRIESEEKSESVENIVNG